MKNLFFCFCFFSLSFSSNLLFVEFKPYTSFDLLGNNSYKLCAALLNTTELECVNKYAPVVVTKRTRLSYYYFTMDEPRTLNTLEEVDRIMEFNGKSPFNYVAMDTSNRSFRKLRNIWLLTYAYVIFLSILLFLNKKKF